MCYCSASSAISPDQKTIVVCNLFNGFDRYSLDDTDFLQSYTVRMQENIVLPVKFIHNGSKLLFGSSCGSVNIVNCDTGCCISVLPHDGALDDPCSDSRSSHLKDPFADDTIQSLVRFSALQSDYSRLIPAMVRHIMRIITDASLRQRLLI